MAIFEAVQTYDASKGATLRTWVGIVIRWRMGELLHRMSRKGGYEFIDHDWAANAHAEHAVDDFEARMDALERLQRLAENFAVLPHRTKIILTQRLAGVESTEIAGSLGITACREQQILQECRATLRKALAESESVLTAEPTAAGTSEG
jgi:RNA polymerase sigma factor (sigma-70 family)